MNVRLSALVATAILFFLPGCDWFGASKKEDPKLRIISVLEKKYFDDAHIKGGPHVEVLNIDQEDIVQLAKNWDKNVPVVTYCSNYYCTASDDTAKKLKQLGFSNVRVYKGGIAEWYQLSKKDPLYAVDGPATGESKKAFLDIVVENPGASEEEIKIIDAPELQKSIKEANLST